MLMLNEAARCLDEGIIRSPRDGDIGAVFGIGFPPFLGGPFRYMDSLGAANVVNTLANLMHQYGDRFAPCEALRQRAERGENFTILQTMRIPIMIQRLSKDDFAAPGGKFRQ